VIEAGGTERARLLSKQKSIKRKDNDKQLVEQREVNSRREPRTPPFPGEYFQYSVKV